jgi:hypothetical protein
VLTNEERAELTALVHSQLTSVGLSLHARIVAPWRERYLQLRLAGIERDLPRGAPPVKIDVAQLVALTIESKPEAATQWSTEFWRRSLASAVRPFRVTGGLVSVAT